jgi:hypothetical protein
VRAAAGATGDFVVAAGRGADPLRCYLRPNHWRGDATDPYPNRAVVPFAAERAAASLASLADLLDPCVLVVLTGDEVERLDAAARTELARAFVLVEVVASARAHGHDTVSVYRRTPAR